MKVLLVALGSSGDVNPVIGLGRRLARRGHAVTVLGDVYYRRFIEETGLRFVPVGSSSRYLEVSRGERLGGFRPDRPGTGGLAFVDQIRPTYDAAWPKRSFRMKRSWRRRASSTARGSPTRSLGCRW